MENNVNPYGGDVAESTGNSGTGAVSGYRLVAFGPNDKNSLELEFEKTFSSGKSMRLKGWLNDVDPNKVTVFEGQTQEKAVASAFTKLKRTIWNLVRNYADEATVAAAQGRVTSWETLMSEAKGCLPDNFNEIEGTLVVGYKENGFLAFPTRMQWDAATSRHLPFFSVNPSDTLCGLGNLKAEKPEVAVEATEEVSW